MQVYHRASTHHQGVEVEVEDNNKTYSVKTKQYLIFENKKIEGEIITPCKKDCLENISFKTGTNSGGLVMKIN